MKFSFVRSRGFAASAIGWFSASDWSHVDIVVPTGLLGARSDKIGGRPPGVQIRPFDYEGWQHRLVMELPCDSHEEAAALAFLMEQVGKPYDKLAIVAFAIDRNWRDEGSWFCSELATRAIEVSGRCPELPATPNRIAPGGCALIVGALGGKVLNRY